MSRCSKRAGTGLGVCLLMLGTLLGCRQEAAEQPRRYPFQGQILAVDKQSSEVTVRHQDIPGLMKGMTMPFRVKNETAFSQLRPGLHIKATLVIDDGDSWLADVTIVPESGRPSGNTR